MFHSASPITTTISSHHFWSYGTANHTTPAFPEKKKHPILKEKHAFKLWKPKIWKSSDTLLHTGLLWRGYEDQVRLLMINKVAWGELQLCVGGVKPGVGRPWESSSDCLSGGGSWHGGLEAVDCQDYILPFNCLCLWLPVEFPSLYTCIIDLTQAPYRTGLLVYRGCFFCHF